LVLVVPDDDEDEDEEFYEEDSDDDEDDCEDDEDEEEEDDDEDDDDDDEREYGEDEDYENEEDEDYEDSDEEDDEEEYTHPFPTPSHWPPQIIRQRTPLLHLIHSHLLNHFTAAPSLQLYQVLIRLSPPTTTTSLSTNANAHAIKEKKKEINAILDNIATSSSDTFVAALDIHSHNFFHDPWRGDGASCIDSSAGMLSSLLTSHSHLLRPRDAPILQKAISFLASVPFSLKPPLSQNPFQNQNSKYTLLALRILEKEMTETALTLRASLLPLFSGLSDVDKCTSEMGVIARMRAASAARVDRVQRWVDGVSTPRVGGDGNGNAGGPAPPHPMALAAFMMGLPLFPGALAPDDEDDEDADASDPFGYLDSLDSNSVDPELEDLKEEFRPRIKERFGGWVEVGSIMPGGAGVLLRVYIKILGLMPFFRVGDVVDEIISRYVPPLSLRC
jgi:hypothetical protein